MRYIISTILLVSINIFGQSQNTQFEVSLTPINILELGGIQSYAVGTYQGEWLIIGGRVDGLHRREPFASFDVDGNNQDLIVVNPDSKKVWKKSVESLPSALKEQLSSSNMQFYQNEDHLIITGGYGFSATMDDHITYPYLTVVDVPNVIKNVKNGVVSSDDFEQVEDETFQVTGGRLAMIDEAYFLVGGHKFMGRYNPIGSTHGPGFEQEYTNEIRKFTLQIGDVIDLNIHAPIHDEMNLRRRDYNLVPTIVDDEYGLTAFSGVFQNGADFPWLYPVRITGQSYEPIHDFNQYFNHYHCATLPIYDEANKEMHTLFFGGIAQFYMEDEVLVQDNDIPFVNTISDVCLSGNGAYTETILTTEMPGYLGAGSEFIFSSDSKNYKKGILSGDSFDEEFVDVGYIYGGIRSSLPNIFWLNTGAESEASKTILKVSIRKRKTTSISQQPSKKDKVLFYPNPVQKLVRMSIDLEDEVDVYVDISDIQGLKIHSQKILKSDVKTGSNLIVLDNVNIGYGAFLYNVTFGNQKVVRKVIWAE